MSDDLNNKVHDNSDESLEKTSEEYILGNYITFKGVCLLDNYNELADSIENFKVRDDDVWVCTFPKSGTTWTQELVWCIANDLDYEAAKAPLIDRFPSFDVLILGELVSHDKFKANKTYSAIKSQGMKYYDELSSPRFIKTHLPFHLLPRELRDGEKGAKIVHVTRNPKDTCLSLYHHASSGGAFKAPLQKMCSLFLNDKVLFAPFWGHLSGYLNQADNFGDRILFLKYEDMQKDLASVINKTAEFFRKPKLCGENLERLVDNLSFEKMKKSPGMKYLYAEKSPESGQPTGDKEFFRSGKMDQWKSEMTPEMIKEFDDWTASNLMSLMIQDKMSKIE